MMYSECIRKLREVNRDIEIAISNIDSTKYREKIAIRWFNYYGEKLEKLKNSAFKITDAERELMEKYSRKMEDYFKKARNYILINQENIEKLESLESERDQLLEWKRHYDGMEVCRDLEESDYILLIRKDGLIHGTKL